MADEALSHPAVKVPFDSLTLRAVVAELRALLIGGQIQDVRQPTPTDLLLGIRSKGRNFLLLLSADARFARIHLTSTRQANAATPPAFCMAVRKYGEGASVRDIRQRGFDRIFEMDIAAGSREDPASTVTLIAELMGKHSNLILIRDDGTIVDAAKRIGRRVNRFREILPGLPYRPGPEETDKQNPFAQEALERVVTEIARQPEITVALLSDRLRALIAGMSPFLAREIALRAIGPSIPSSLRPVPRSEPAGDSTQAASAVPADKDRERQEEADRAEAMRAAWAGLFGAAARNAFDPVLIREEERPAGAYPFPSVQIAALRQEHVAELNAALDAAFAARQERAELDAVTAELHGKIHQEIKRLERQRQSAERTLSEAHRAEEYKEAGDLLLANLRHIQPGDSAVSVQDYYDPAGSDRVIALDPKLTPQENVDAYFRRYRKARDGERQAQERQDQTTVALDRLRQAEARLEALDALADVRGLQAELLKQGLLRTAPEAPDAAHPAGPDFQGHKIRWVTTPEGYEIYIGETATANDFLTTRIAAPNDLWLHVRAATSAHVVIRTRNRPDQVPRAVLERAALLCAQHSSQKHSSLVPVDYTLKKYVRKPRGAAPGAVLVTHEKTLHITP